MPRRDRTLLLIETLRCQTRQQYTTSLLRDARLVEDAACGASVLSSGKRKCAGCCMCGTRFTHGEARPQLSCLEGDMQIHGDIEPSPVVLGEQTTMEKTTQRFQRIATTLADLNAEGLNAQAVNDPLTMYVGAASQHVLRMSFVPEQEARNFDRQVPCFWSHLIQRDITSPLFFLSLKLGGLGVGSAVQRHAAAPWRAWQSIIPTLMSTTQSSDTDFLFSSTPRLRAQPAQLQTTLSLQMNKPTFPLKPFGAALRLRKPLKRNKSPPFKETSTSNFTTA